jgi:hypothetical protein
LRNTYVVSKKPEYWRHKRATNNGHAKQARAVGRLRTQSFGCLREYRGEHDGIAKADPNQGASGDDT